MNRIRTYIIVFQNIIYINYGRYIFILYWYNDIYNQTQTSTIEKIRDLSFFLIQCEFFIAYNLLSWKKTPIKQKQKIKQKTPFILPWKRFGSHTSLSASSTFSSLFFTSKHCPVTKWINPQPKTNSTARIFADIFILRLGGVRIAVLSYLPATGQRIDYDLTTTSVRLVSAEIRLW